VLFDVRVIAFDPHAAVDPVEALVRLFKIDRSFAREVVHRLPRVIKRGVTLEMAQRLGQVLERIGAQVEILVSERVPDQSEGPQPAASLPAGASVGGMSRSTLGKGLPPPSPEALVQQPSNTNTNMAPALVRRAGPYAAARPEALASLPEPSLNEEGAAPLRHLANVRASLPQPLPSRRPSAVAQEPATPNVRTPASARQALPNESAMGRLSLPMGTWSDPTEQEDSGVTRASVADAVAAAVVDARVPARAPEARPSAREQRAEARPAPREEEARGFGREQTNGRGFGREQTDGRGFGREVTQENERPSMVGGPLAKPSVKEILARRSLSQTGAGVERITRPGEPSASAVPGARAEPLALPTFSAKGSSIADDVEELPETVSLRRKLTFVTVLIFMIAGVFSAGLLPLVVWIGRVVKGRQRVRTLRERQASSVLVGQAQLPELYHCVKHLAIRLELSPSPRLYVVERLPTKVQSFTQGGNLVIALDATLLSICARRDAGYVVQFLLAHEMAAHILGQHRGGREFLASTWANLRKHELFSADAVAAKLMADRSEPIRALSALLCGPELAHLIDLNELDRQASNQEQDAARAQASADDDPSYLLPRILHLRRNVGK
jgi:hypothetical protein